MPSRALPALCPQVYFCFVFIFVLVFIFFSIFQIHSIELVSPLSFTFYFSYIKYTIFCVSFNSLFQMEGTQKSPSEGDLAPYTPVTIGKIVTPMEEVNSQMHGISVTTRAEKDT